MGGGGGGSESPAGSLTVVKIKELSDQLINFLTKTQGN